MSKTRKKPEMDLSHLVPSQEPARRPPRVIVQRDGYRIVCRAMDEGCHPSFAFEQAGAPDAMGNIAWSKVVDPTLQACQWLTETVGCVLTGVIS